MMLMRVMQIMQLMQLMRMKQLKMRVRMWLGGCAYASLRLDGPIVALRVRVCHPRRTSHGARAAV
jgi:hypothetical protein